MEFAAHSLNAISQYQAGKYYGALGEAQKKQANIDASLTEKEGKLDSLKVLDAGAREEASFRKKAEATRGSNILAIARSGIIMEGSPLRVMNEVAMETEREALGIRTYSINTAADIDYQAKMNARNLRISGEYAYNEGKFKKKQSYYGAGASLLQGAASLVKSGSSASGGF